MAATVPDFNHAVATMPATSSDTVVILFAAVVLACLAIYMSPTIVAAVRGVPHTGSVAVINLLVGWSLVGWAVAWALALRSVPKATAAPGGDAGVTWPAGWYPDPLRTGRLRFWSGHRWTDSVTPAAPSG